ncbi:hypothetical protein HPP92_022720 [Vanilla planifolia]|uniref:Uncharacterized protein n=1 Tax=Vanilla planifolia TaxID=51239 RepID=A0A835PUM7_VANPL|nr:hypothetical protein HPP92_022720 [Vanilla planifolia]
MAIFIKAGNLVYKKELLIGMKDGTNLTNDDELAKADDEDGLTKASPVSPGKSAIDSPSQEADLSIEEFA